ncbi:hypothetical protein ACH434_17720 [Lysinibacillus fusiformis]|uniref:hypothetical protein n=1 Tax=Lysinibacillus fusiformis TaxID=28031 RepID=UPI0037BAC55A
MAEAVCTLKLIEAGTVVTSDVMNFEFDDNVTADYVITSKRFPTRKIVAYKFPKSEYEKILYGEKDAIQLVGYIDNEIYHIDEKHLEMLTDEYFKKTNKALKVLKFQPSLI